MNEIMLHSKGKIDNNFIIGFYGITQDPKTKDYMMILDYAEDGSLRDYLDKNYSILNWDKKRTGKTIYKGHRKKIRKSYECEPSYDWSIGYLFTCFRSKNRKRKDLHSNFLILANQHVTFINYFYGDLFEN
ncbi:unnamed protein product [Rhizophagus irregularis]|nr:unnamed protein product [Rhizophagus irregularis]